MLRPSAAPEFEMSMNLSAVSNGNRCALGTHDMPNMSNMSNMSNMHMLMHIYLSYPYVLPVTQN
eukprot:264561-Prymnesium_polylepis.1